MASRCFRVYEDVILQDATFSKSQSKLAMYLKHVYGNVLVVGFILTFEDLDLDVFYRDWSKILFYRNKKAIISRFYDTTDEDGTTIRFHINKPADFFCIKAKTFTLKIETRYEV